MAHWSNNHTFDPTSLFMVTGNRPQRDVAPYSHWMGSGGSGDGDGNGSGHNNALTLGGDTAFGAESTYGLDAETPKPPEAMIKEFNNDEAFPEAQNYEPNLEFGALFEDETDSSAIPAFFPSSVSPNQPSSFNLYRTNSAYSHASGASSSFQDETSSRAFSVCSLEQFNPSFQDSFDIISPTSTTGSDILMADSASHENSPIGRGKCPWLNMNENSLPGSNYGTPPLSQEASVSSGSSFSARNFAPAANPRQSSLALGLARRAGTRPRSGTVPSDMYFSGWSSILEADAMDSRSWNPQPNPGDSLIADVHNTMHPSLHSLPAVMPEIRVDPFDVGDSFDGNLGNLTRTNTHPMDWLAMPLEPALQIEQKDGFASLPASRSSLQHLSVPKTSKRRVSDPPRLISQPQPLSQQAGPPRPADSSGAITTTTTAPMPIRNRQKARSPALKSVSFNSTSSLKMHPSTRGRRQGPLEPDTRRGAKRTRNDKSVCIRCKHSKQKCKRADIISESPCFQCLQHGSTPKWPGPCVKAYFEDIIVSGSCNYISQRAVNHLTMDRKRRVRRELPEVFELDGMLEHLAAVKDKFNFKISQADKPIYVLNLEKCYEYISSIREQLVNKDFDLRSFIDREILRIDSKTDDWTSCLLECQPKHDQLALLCVWNNMPSRASFSYVSKSTGQNGKPFEQLVNVEDDAEWDNLLLAAQLSRIMCRKLEVEAYMQLQKILHKSGDLSGRDLVAFLQRLGRILSTLRWRISWWRLLGDGGVAPDAAKEQFETRVQSLCTVLYFYFCSVRRRLPAWTSNAELRGIRSNYADTATQVWDDFPGVESIEGFNEWMQRGQQLIVDAGVAGKLVGIGLAK